MRDLSSEELVHVYGAGSKQSPCGPKHRPNKPKKRNPCKGKGGSGSGSHRSRCGKGGSS